MAFKTAASVKERGPLLPVHDSSTIIIMTDRQRQLAMLRFMEIESELEALAEGRVVDGDPATVEGELLDEQESIEFEFWRVTSIAAMDDKERRFRERFDVGLTCVLLANVRTGDRGLAPYRSW